MSRGRQKIEFHGLLQQNVLGTFSVIRGFADLRDSGLSPIRRIDGNHRLEAARRLAEEWTRSATFKNFATAPFCFVILNSDRPEDDDLAEAMLFNLINSKRCRS